MLDTPSDLLVLLHLNLAISLCNTTLNPGEESPQTRDNQTTTNEVNYRHICSLKFGSLVIPRQMLRKFRRSIVTSSKQKIF